MTTDQKTYKYCKQLAKKLKANFVSRRVRVYKGKPSVAYYSFCDGGRELTLEGWKEYFNL